MPRFPVPAPGAGFAQSLACEVAPRRSVVENCAVVSLAANASLYQYVCSFPDLRGGFTWRVPWRGGVQMRVSEVSA